jgi:hypothetical protein
MDVVFSANNTSADYKNGFVVSAGTLKGNGILTNPSNTAVATINSYQANLSSTTTTNSLGTQSADLDILSSFKIIYSFTASANAIFKYQFSNNNALAGAISRTFKGSILKYKKIN